VYLFGGAMCMCFYGGAAACDRVRVRDALALSCTEMFAGSCAIFKAA